MRLLLFDSFCGPPGFYSLTGTLAEVLHHFVASRVINQNLANVLAGVGKTTKLGKSQSHDAAFSPTSGCKISWTAWPRCLRDEKKGLCKNRPHLSPLLLTLCPPPHRTAFVPARISSLCPVRELPFFLFFFCLLAHPIVLLYEQNVLSSKKKKNCANVNPTLKRGRKMHKQTHE